MNGRPNFFLASTSNSHFLRRCLVMAMDKTKSKVAPKRCCSYLLYCRIAGIGGPDFRHTIRKSKVLGYPAAVLDAPIGGA